jgi:hypothetical protein
VERRSQIACSEDPDAEEEAMMSPKPITALDAASPLPVDIESHWRGASEFWRSA